jgi:hypothetical protein
MPPIHPLAAAHALARWQRHDAHRFLRPDWQRYVQPGSELAKLSEQIERKYRPDQPRVPAGVREGGQWTDDSGTNGGSSHGSRDHSAGGEVSNPSPVSTPGVILSDETPDPIRPGAQYAAVIQIEPSAITGDPRIDSATVKLSQMLGQGSVRTDVVLRGDAGKIIAIYDAKTGSADVHPARAAELRIKAGVDNTAPILILKTFKIPKIQRWTVRSFTT